MILKQSYNMRQTWPDVTKVRKCDIKTGIEMIPGMKWCWKPAQDVCGQMKKLPPTATPANRIFKKRCNCPRL
jgi:hypothetical protein